MVNKSTHKCFCRAFAVLFLFLLSLTTGVQAQKDMREANKLLREGKYHQALMLYQKAEPLIKDSRESAKAHCLSKMGECYLNMHYYSLALPYFRKAMEYDSAYVYSLVSYSQVLKNNGLYDELLDAFVNRQFKNDKAEVDSVAIVADLLYCSFPAQNMVENKIFSAHPQKNIQTLGKKRGLSIRNGKLYYASTNYTIAPEQKDYPEKVLEYTLFSSPIVNSFLANSTIEEELLNIKDNIVYTVIQPQTNKMFFTVVDANNKEYLYEKADKDEKWKSAAKVKVGKKVFSLSHPVFTALGDTMIFSAELPNGYGGKDLWYSVCTENGWDNPVNLGNEINTSGDEITPFLYRDYLIFSSNGQAESYGGFDIYGTFWTDELNQNVENLKYPYNSFADDFEMVIEADSSRGFFVSTRDTSYLDDRIYSFSELPNFAIAKGVVYDNYKKPLPNADIRVLENEVPIYATKSDRQGEYQIYLKHNKQYIVEIGKDNYLPTTKEYAINTDNYIGNTVFFDYTILDGFDLNYAYKVDGIFYQTASSELIDEKDKLSTIVTFLKENKHLDLHIFLFCYSTSNEKFNDLLNKSRIESLKNYFADQSVSEKRIHFESYTNEKPTECGDIDREKDSDNLVYLMFAPQDYKVKKIKTTSVVVE